ncbi:GxxExxY protein [Candidatus Sumerlaeota bacterium]|nr:GxxExxY protein [Candidatus Sumerlaeota bacterium]
MELLFKDEVYKIIGAAMEVYNHLGIGFLEAVYQEALEIEFKLQNIPFQSQVPLKIYYKVYPLQKGYTPDFLVYNEIVLDIKAEKTLTKIDEAIIFNYIRCSHKKLGLLINFCNQKKLEWKRFIL